MYRSNSDSLLEVADCNGIQQVRSLRSAGLNQHHDEVRLLETRLGLSAGVRQSLTGPVTALVANVESCLCLLEQILSEAGESSELHSRIGSAQTLMRHASDEAKKTVGLLQHWRSVQQLTPGRKTSINVGQFIRDCGMMLRPQRDAQSHSIEFRIGSVRSVYVDQFGLYELLERVLLRDGSRPLQHPVQSLIDCQDDNGTVVVRIQQKLKDEENAGACCGERTDSSGANDSSYRGISQEDIDNIARVLRDVGGHLQWSVVTSESIDFGLSFRALTGEVLRS